MRLRLQITGLVQGVGFRPFVFRLAEESGLHGYVLNDTSGVFIEVEGDKDRLDSFLHRIIKEKPGLSKIYSLQHTYLEDAGFSNFEIRESEENGEKRASILPDISACDDCVNDITTPKNRRFIYPFTNCTNCGPRFTIINSLPYDRGNTSMKDFQMCPECEREFNLASDRRFHAQPNACPVCGPWTGLYDSRGNVICEREEALEKVVNLVRKGNIIAVKGVGGYHLVCDATSEEAVVRLRERKHREEKPMAVMFPDMKSIKAETNVSSLEERAIDSIEKPVVIVRKKETTTIANSVSPGNITVGVFLPYTPLHHIMLRKLKKPVVATSANMTDEPIVRDEKDAFNRLSGIADYLLTHNRDIVRRSDDSVVRIAAERQTPLRRSRGFVPSPLIVPFRFSKPVLALGANMNNTIALGIDNKVYMSQHIGDLDTPLAVEFYEETVNDFLRLFDMAPEVIVSDMHPGYYSTKFGEKHYGDKLIKVQHHYAHILSCMIENDVPEDAGVIGFAFDGTGYGPDKTIWGGEVLTASYKGFERAFHLRHYKLPGGDVAVREPRRTALSLLYETFGDEAERLELVPFKQEEKYFLINMLRKNINSPFTTSMGRLFDGVASLIGLRHKVSYHAQAAVELEQLAFRSDEASSYPFAVENGVIDQRPMIEMIVRDLKAGSAKELIARKFHNTIVQIIIFTAELLKDKTGMSYAVLSGGVFQNSFLLENAYYSLKERGFTPFIHQLVPPNDGGISLGQAVYGNSENTTRNL
ncbi:MAG: carbamoyltransferase HypF [Nitrospirae bacterium]|nr:carbamoyltransferase HypF [Nitrospirota bacterium]